MNNLPRWGPSMALAIVLVGLVVVIAFSGGLFERTADTSPMPSAVAAGTSSPSATQASVVTPSGGATLTPSGGPTLTPVPASAVPSAEPSSPASQPPSAPPSAQPSAPPTVQPQSRFRQVDGFPAPGERVNAISAGGPGFVAVGYAANPEPDCPERVDGRIWTSADGERWTAQAADALDEVPMWGVVDAGATLYAFGRSGSGGDCPGSDRIGNDVWRSSDGIAWEHIASGIRFESDRDAWNDVAVAGSTLVVVGAFGYSGDGPDRGGGVWTSTNGVDWQIADRTPRTSNLISVAAMGDTVVAFGEDSAEGLAWHSQDAGRTWRRGRIDTGYHVWSVDLIAADGRFVAVARACCGLPQASVGIALASTDGRVWSAGPDPEAHRYGGERALVVPGGLLALTDSSETRLSTDGQHWRAGPPGPALSPDRDFITAAAAGANGVVMVANQQLGDERVLRAWFAPLHEFALAGWTAPAESPEWPVIGQAYRYSLYTHCGAANTRVVFAGSVWLMDESTLEGRFNDPGDRGHLTQLTADRAFYEGRRGGSFYLDRAESTPPWPFCA